MNSFSSTTQTLASPFRHSRPAAVRISLLAEWDGHEAVKALQARYSLRGTDAVHALNRVQSLAIVSADGQRVRVVFGRLMRTPLGDQLHLLDEDGLPIGFGIQESQIVGWSSDVDLEASCIARLEDLEDLANHAWLVNLLGRANEARQLELAA